MAENRPITPEKQLLRLIEGSGGGPAAARKLSPASVGSAMVGGWAFFKRTLSGKGFSKSSFSLVPLNKVLTAAVAAFFLYILADALVSTVRLLRPADIDLKSEKTVSAPAAVSSSLNDEAFYTGKFASRDVFSPGSAAPPPSANAPAQPDPNAAVADLSLVGIAWSAKPEVIIEDKSKQRTFFMKEGQALGDGVVVKKVFKDHAVLGYNGQEFELR